MVKLIGGDLVEDDDVIMVSAWFYLPPLAEERECCLLPAASGSGSVLLSPTLTIHRLRSPPGQATSINHPAAFLRGLSTLIVIIDFDENDCTNGPPSEAS